jgi:pimeloyl-ACP methyl ester carboxylesterase
MATLDVGGRAFGHSVEGSGPAVVLIHGLLMDRTMWDHQVDGFRDAYRVLTVDAPGHGDSDPVEVGYTFGDLARDIWALCDAVGISEAVFGGQSFGGWTAMHCALQRPKDVRGIVMIDTTAGSEDPERLPQYEAFLTVALEGGVTGDLADAVMLILFGSAFVTTAEGEAWKKKLAAIDVHRALGVIRAVFDRPSIEHRLVELRQPGIVIHGEEDVAIPIERGEALAAALGATLVRVPGAGHASPLENPRFVTPPIRDFLDRLA